MVKLFFLIIGILAIFSSCDASSKFYKTDIVKYKDIDIHYDTIHLYDITKLNAEVLDLLCIDNYLIVAQDNNDSLFIVIDTKTDSIIASFGKIGHARNEFHTTPEIVYCIRKEDGSPLLCVLEEVDTKIIDLQKSIEANMCIISEIIKEKKNSFFYHTYHLPGNKRFIFKTASYKDPRDEIYFPPEFSLMDKKEKIWNIYPEIIKPQFKSSVIGDYYSTISVTPDGRHLANVNYHIGIITIFDLEKKLSTGIIYPDSYSYDYLESEVTDNNVDEKIRIYNLAACATNQGFVVLECGKTLKEKSEDDNNCRENVGLKLLGYDWEGNCLFAFNVDKNISYIAYNENDKKIYATDLLNGKLYNCIIKQ